MTTSSICFPKHHLHHGLLCSAVSRTSAHSTQISLPLLFATVHLSAFQKCFYDLSQSIEYLHSGRGRGQNSLPTGTARPARPSQLRVCRSAWPLILTAAHDGRTPKNRVSVLRCDAAQTVSPVCVLIGWFASKCLCKRHHQIWRKNILLVRLFKDTNRTTLTELQQLSHIFII